MKEQIEIFLKKHHRVVLPLFVGVAVFFISQGALLLTGGFSENPLPHLGDTSLNLVAPANLQNLEARVIAPTANIDVPIVWSTSRKEADLQQDLEHGALRYPGTPEPGDAGNSFITAHSSDYPWKPGDYKQAFTNLGKLKEGDDVYVAYSYQGGEIRRVHFKVTEKDIVSASDMRLIEQRDKTEITLATCWPIGTSWRRLMVKAELVEG